ncbi:MAG TPA: 7TM-DISM domain-containing protein, partial [Arenimonas sp.]|nr:7TM-DISM domain-containing protein [Arenimonas sp.]
MAPPLSVARGRTALPSARFTKPWWGFACLGAWLLLSAVAQAAPPDARVGPGTRSLDLLPHLSVLEDPEQTLALRDVLRPENASRFSPLGGRTASFGYSDSAWWLRAVVSNETGQSRKLVLRQSYVLLDHFDVYIVED